MSPPTPALLVLLPAILACDEEKAAPPKIHTDVAVLGRLVELPVAPKAATFEVIRIGTRSFAPGPSDFKLYAVLEFSEADAVKLIRELETKDRGISVELRPWFPPALERALEPSGKIAQRKLAGRTFSAKPFETMQYRGGALVQLGEAPIFFLTLQTM